MLFNFFLATDTFRESAKLCHGQQEFWRTLGETSGVVLLAKVRGSTNQLPIFLHGFTDSEEKWFRTPDHWINLPTVLNRAFGASGNHEMIVVMPNAFTRFEGSFYGSSTNTGDWEGFISEELVAYVDSHYRTLAKPDSRGLAGHSMGGYGAIRIGMKHSEVFSSVYALSPCCLDVSGLAMSEMMTTAASSVPTFANAFRFCRLAMR